uniref:Uncharacterized protein n=1 Tax=Siphoviridae sp. ct6YY1 TaxID=2825343 RepID=A0A8S5V3A4_9CAUD|nr:MAG TPA: hypothetical protein [Siphoviridae sp. ct6YY1]
MGDPSPGNPRPTLTVYGQSWPVTIPKPFPLVRGV